MSMSIHRTVSAVDTRVDTSGSGVWHRLHSERENICETLLKDCHLTGVSLPSTEGETRAETWHRALLEARLRKVDDALDRLMSGSYGNCTQCGRWIQDNKLDFDPAIAFCLSCWERLQTQH
ncbi:MAG TPA: hypothetical protein VMS31_14225 [Pyrinomonadaceae bacterium]|nr:hypothetical protein [Pyrinomonadaceae bacterium]